MGTSIYIMHDISTRIYIRLNDLSIYIGTYLFYNKITGKGKSDRDDNVRVRPVIKSVVT